MARTFIGELILRMKDDASGKAQAAAGKMESSMDRINRAAKRLGDAPWGGRFQSQLDKLGASARDLDHLRSSWERLQASFQKDNLSKAMQRTQIANWKTAVLGDFIKGQQQIRRELAETEKHYRNWRYNVSAITRAGLVMMGGYTGAYMGGMMAREGLVAASNEQRERARQHFAGLPKTEQDQIEKQAGELSVKYRTTQAAAMEIMREARLAMPSAEAAFSVAEEMIQAYKMLGLMYGPDQAITGLRAFNKAMDNINVNQNRDEYRTALDSYIKAQQITGKDMDPEGYAQAIKYARTSGKVFGHDFLFNWLPYIISESGGSDAGTQLRAAFDQFIVGRASKQSKKKQAAFGLRDDDDRLLGQQQFGENPITWIKDVLLPQLQKKGVDTEDTTELARVLGELTNNRLSADLLSRVLLSYEQYKRQVDMATNAVGLEGAKDIDSLDPFSAFKGFKDAMANLSAAVLPMEGISAGLISLADGINSVSQAWRDGDWMAKAGITGAGIGGAYGIYKVVSGLLALGTAGPALMGAAASLEAAAISLGAAGGNDILGGDGGKKKSRGLFGSGWFTPVTLGAAGITGLAAVAEKYKEYRRDHPEIQERDDAKTAQNMQALRAVVDAMVPDRGNEDILAGQRAASTGGNPLQDAVDNATRLGGGPVVDTGQIDGAQQKAEQAGQDILTALSVVATPVVNTGALDAALAKAREFVALMRQANSLASATPSGGSVTRQMNRNFTDHGVVP